MAVPGLIAGRVGDDDQAAVAVGVPVRLEYFATIGGHHGRAFWGGNVQAAVAAWGEPVDLAKVRRDLSVRGPDAVELGHQRAHGRPEPRDLLTTVVAGVGRWRGQAGDQVRIDQRVVRDGPLHLSRLCAWAACSIERTRCLSRQPL